VAINCFLSRFVVVSIDDIKSEEFFSVLFSHNADLHSFLKVCLNF
jgi:hypothetical protein